MGLSISACKQFWCPSQSAKHVPLQPVKMLFESIFCFLKDLVFLDDFLLLESDFLLSLLDRQDSLHLFPVHSGPEKLRVSTAGKYYVQHQVAFHLLSPFWVVSNK